MDGKIIRREVISIIVVKFLRDKGEIYKIIRKKLEELKETELWKAYTTRQRGKIINKL